MYDTQGTPIDRSFYFVGNSKSLQNRLTSMTDEQVNQINDAHINVNGTEIKPYNNCAFLFSVILAGIFIFPIFFVFCDWWNRWVNPAFNIAPSVYNGLGKIFNSPSLRSITITVVDNTFDANKANILYQFVSQSRIVGMTFTNKAGNYDYNDSEYSNFTQNMRPIKQLTHVISYICWGTQIA